MNECTICSKMAFDIKKQKLGKIVRVDKLLGRTIKKLTPHAIIDFKIPRDGYMRVSLETKKIKEITAEYVIFNTLKKSIVEQVKKEQVINKLLYETSKIKKSKGIGKFGIRMSSLVRDDLSYLLFYDRNRMS